MSGRALQVEQSLRRLREAAEALARPVAFMEVCGTHTVAAFRSGLHSLMPQNVSLLSGPGCPVCVTSQGDIDLLISAGSVPDVTVCTYGDMLRVTGSGGSLEQARSRGADVRVVYSTMDALKLAKENPGRQVVFAAVGFETTAPASAIAVLEAKRQGVGNFTVLVSHKLIMPAMRALLGAGEVNVAGFLLPGHVSVILGARTFDPVADEYGLPCVIAGFEDYQIAAAMARLCEMVRDGVVRAENQYPQAVNGAGNTHAQAVIEQAFEPADATWRGLGELPGSGLRLRGELAEFDAASRFGLKRQEVPEPPGCRCGEVITGKCTPADCRLFGKVCTPIRPVGPCMVSSEGTCQAWFKYNRARASAAASRATSAAAGQGMCLSGQAVEGGVR